MSDSTATVQNQQTSPKSHRHPVSGRRVLNIALWVFQVLLAFQIAAGGFLKLSGDPTMVDMFAAIGAGQGFRYVVGVLEVAAAFGLVIPRLSSFAALGLVGLMAGAAATNVFVLGTAPWLPLGFLAVSATIAWVRMSQKRNYKATRAVQTNKETAL